MSHDEPLCAAEALGQAITRAETAEAELAESRALHKVLAQEARKHFVLLNVSGDELSVENIAELGRWVDGVAGVPPANVWRDAALRAFRHWDDSDNPSPEWARMFAEWLDYEIAKARDAKEAQAG